MDLLLTALRLIHILAAFTWFGLGLTFALFVGPAADFAGESGLRFFKALFSRTRYPAAFGISAGLTVLAGILLYLVGNASSHFSSTGNIVLGVGAVAGLLAAAHGGAATGRATTALAEVLNKRVPDNQPIPADAKAELDAATQKVARLARISFYITLVALICMGSARYL